MTSPIEKILNEDVHFMANLESEAFFPLKSLFP